VSYEICLTRFWFTADPSQNLLVNSQALFVARHFSNSKPFYNEFIRLPLTTRHNFRVSLTSPFISLSLRADLSPSNNSSQFRFDLHRTPNSTRNDSTFIPRTNLYESFHLPRRNLRSRWVDADGEWERRTKELGSEWGKEGDSSEGEREREGLGQCKNDGTCCSLILSYRIGKRLP